MALNADGYNTFQIIYYESFPWPVADQHCRARDCGLLCTGECLSAIHTKHRGQYLRQFAVCAMRSPGQCQSVSLLRRTACATAPHYPFYDITSGCNNNDITEKYGLISFCAGPGYDLVTGWGSANMLQLAWTINNFLAGDSGAHRSIFGSAHHHWYNTDQTISWTVTDTSANGHPPNGVAGFTAFWDLDPGDPYREPPGEATWGSWNSFIPVRKLLMPRRARPTFSL